MLEKLLNLLRWLKSSMDNHSLGASARKLSAFALMACIVMLHMAYRNYAISQNDFSLFPTILTIDISGVLAFLGLTTWQMIKDKQGNAAVDSTTTEVKKSDDNGSTLG